MITFNLKAPSGRLHQVTCSEETLQELMKHELKGVSIYFLGSRPKFLDQKKSG